MRSGLQMSSGALGVSWVSPVCFLGLTLIAHPPPGQCYASMSKKSCVLPGCFPDVSWVLPGCFLDASWAPFRTLPRMMFSLHHVLLWAPIGQVWALLTWALLPPHKGLLFFLLHFYCSRCILSLYLCCSVGSPSSSCPNHPSGLVYR